MTFYTPKAMNMPEKCEIGHSAIEVQLVHALGMAPPLIQSILFPSECSLRARGYDVWSRAASRLLAKIALPIMIMPKTPAIASGI